MKFASLFFVVNLFFVIGVSAQVKYTDHTLRLEDGKEASNERVSRLSWLRGTWSGSGLGGDCQEVWTISKGGAMIGVFSFEKAGVPVFNEYMSFVEIDGKLYLKIKHFNPDMTGWEDKANSTTFPFIKFEGDKAYFQGLTYEKVGKNKLKIYLALKEDGKVREEKFSLSRIKKL